jgi:drug/metabolite transporter (DMT)-like permease
MYVLTRMVLFLTVFFVGILIMFNYPQNHVLGIILSFGGLILFGLTIAQAHIKSLE